jgi:mannose/fructose/N-acetylgalactosamine-specific phosphotransferase system component IIB
MSVVLFRVDERLIHGQVVLGWGGRLHPQRIVVVDDDLAASSWEQELYGLGVPPDMEAQFATVDAARDSLGEWQAGDERVFVLTRDVGTMRRLAAGGLLRGADVNIGGIHHAPGRREALPYVFLSGTESSALRALADDGAHVSARDLPGTRAVELNELLEGDVA